MHRTLWLVKIICILSFIDVSTASCSLSNYNNEGYWLKCSNTSLADIIARGNSSISAIVISQSNIPTLPQLAFDLLRENLKALNLHACGIRNIHPQAFSGLKNLRKLKLSNNNISNVSLEWYNDLESLQELDLSFNVITKIDESVYPKMSNLWMLDLRDNQLTCIEPSNLRYLQSLYKIRLQGNPLGLACRAKLSSILTDRGINYLDNTKDQERWLDNALAFCLVDEASTEVQMKQCVLLNLFDQLRSALGSSDSFAMISSQCTNERNALLQCVVRNERDGLENGKVLESLLLELGSG